MKILATGAAGFIGYHASQRLLAAGHELVGVDNLNGYYDTRLKSARLALLRGVPGFRFEPADIADRAAMAALFAQESFDIVLPPSSTVLWDFFTHLPTGFTAEEIGALW